MLYQLSGKNLTLNAVRVLASDLIIPGLAGGAIRSEPFGDTLLKQVASRLNDGRIKGKSVKVRLL